ncbi:unnamed protein product [Polarella glacialis]|uniref:Uncharacterized protein n=1 Tax=Polarella glacialis TaxID=89957 RepID=A0A813LKD9_POLGL|nr:unnamed protein product [Polarella glacialis]
MGSPQAGLSLGERRCCCSCCCCCCCCCCYCCCCYFLLLLFGEKRWKGYVSVFLLLLLLLLLMMLLLSLSSSSPSCTIGLVTFTPSLGTINNHNNSHQHPSLKQQQATIAITQQT